MIVDTSALVAIVNGEKDWQGLRNAINASRAIIPAPVLTEFWLVVGGRNPDLLPIGEAVIASFMNDGVEIVSFEQRHAVITGSARGLYGKGNGRGGLLNFGDLMVYAIAKDRNEPLLCTGRDFASTDLEIHPASRLNP